MVATQRGRGLWHDAASLVSSLENDSRLNLTTEYTVLIEFKFTPGATHDQWAGLFVRASTGTTTSYGLQRNAGTTTLNLYHDSANPHAVGSGEWGNITDGQTHRVAWSWVANAVSYVRDGGTVIHTGTHSFSPTGTTSGRIILGAERTYSTAAAADLTVSHLSIFSRARGVPELTELTRNPYQTFEPEPIEIYWPAAAGGTTIDCTVGTATASGTAAKLDVAINCAVGTATANGTTSALDVGINASVGTATANGTAASLDVGINASVGTATANGIAASIDTGGSTTIDCAVGTATASGATAALDEQLACVVGTATGNGVVCTIEQLSSAQGPRGGGGGYDARRRPFLEWLPVKFGDDEEERREKERPLAQALKARPKRAPAKPAIAARSIADQARDEAAKAKIQLEPSEVVEAKADAAADVGVNDDEFVMVLAQFLLAA